MSHRPLITTLSALFVATLLAAAPAAFAKATPGERAPYFKLKTVTNRLVSRDSLKGRVSVLVVGQTYESAPPCKRWVMALSKSTSAAVYQVIVADKPWFIPRSMVMSKIKGFTPAAYYDHVLVEWYRVFADEYSLPESDKPALLVLDRDGVIRARLEGRPTPRALERVQKLIARL